MWIIKILLPMVISVIGTRAEINGNDLSDDGYLYDPPKPIPAELAFYVNIPAGHDYAPYIARTTNHFHQHQHRQPQLRRPSHRYSRPSEPGPPFHRQNSGSRPVNPPHIQHPESYQFISQHHHEFSVQHPPSQHQQPQFHQDTQPQFQQPQYQIEHSIPYHNSITSSNTITSEPVIFPEQHSQSVQDPLTLSEELQPPPPLIQLFSPAPSHEYSPNHEYSPSTIMASMPNSYNAPLPFPFGAVPLKFSPPLPIKTHLRQEELLRLSELYQVTSYDVNRLYKK